MLSILLSHSSRDRFLVRKLAERLRAYDVNVCLDETEISIGDSLAGKPSLTAGRRSRPAILSQGCTGFAQQAAAARR